MMFFIITIIVMILAREEYQSILAMIMASDCLLNSVGQNKRQHCWCWWWSFTNFIVSFGFVWFPFSNLIDFYIYQVLIMWYFVGCLLLSLGKKLNSMGGSSCSFFCTCFTWWLLAILQLAKKWANWV